MKRTAADFARDATLDVWSFTTSDGRDLTPRPRSFFTYDEQIEVARNDVRWAEIIRDGSEPPDDLESSFLLGLRLRFSKAGEYLAAARAAREEKRSISTIELPDFDAFWADVKDMPLGEAPEDPAQRVGLVGLVAELDAFYKAPIPGSEQEQADADADPTGAAAGKSLTVVS